MKFLTWIISIGFCAALIAGIGGVWIIHAIRTAGPLEEAQIISLDRGQGVRDIAASLQNKNIINHAYPFVISAKIMRNGAPLQAGEYDIPPHASIADIIRKMQTGDVVRRAFTIPEGKTSWEIIRILQNVENLDGDIKSPPKEGILLPDTYEYRKGESRQSAIETMTKAMNDFKATLTMPALQDFPLKTMDDVIILASIVEKETAVPHEYARVAGVFINRLQKGMPLQSDPTVIYGLTKGKHDNEGMGPLGRRLLSTDLKQDTPYNSYTRTGLPPTPICNPGRAAILATLNPENHDFLYFVADGNGGHAFAKTLAEHNKNVTLWRKARKEAEKSTETNAPSATTP